MILETALGIAFVARALAILVVAALGVRVTTSSGDAIEGDLQSVNKTAVVIQVEGREQELAFEELVSIVPVNRDEDATGPPMRVTLLSGSRIAAQDLILADEQLRIEPRRQKPLTVPLKEVKSIRFRPAAPTTDPQWLGLLENKDRRDLLAIRREGNQIDPAPVVVESISGGPDSKVGFIIGEDSGAAPVERLEGIVLGGNRQVAEESDVQVVDVWGSKFLVKSILPSDDRTLRLKLTDTITHEVPTKYLYSISWSTGLVMLASVEPAEASYQPFLKSKLDEKTLTKWFGPSSHQQSDLIMVGGAAVEYRIDGPFTTLAGSVQRDAKVTKAGDVAVAISLDGKEVWKDSLSDGEPRGFEIPLKSSRRVRIEVHCGDDGDIGDTVRVLRPRLLK